VAAVTKPATETRRTPADLLGATGGQSGGPAAANGYALTALGPDVTTPASTGITSPAAGNGSALSAARAATVKQLDPGQGAQYRSLMVVATVFWVLILLVGLAMFDLSVTRWDGWRPTGPITAIASTTSIAAFATLVALANSRRAFRGDTVSVPDLRRPALLSVGALTLMAVGLLAVLAWIVVEVRAGDVAAAVVDTLYAVMQSFVVALAWSTRLMYRRIRAMPRRTGQGRSVPGLSLQGLSLQGRSRQERGGRVEQRLR
jgi:hypothetical protein